LEVSITFVSLKHEDFVSLLNSTGTKKLGDLNFGWDFHKLHYSCLNNICGILGCVVYDKHDISSVVIQTSWLVPPTIQITLCLEELSILLIKNSDDSLKDDNYINFVHKNLHNLSFIWHISWELIKLKHNTFLHSTVFVKEISVEAIVENQSFVLRWKTNLWIQLAHDKNTLYLRTIFLADNVGFLSSQINVFVIPENLCW
jgi:hypothetical protein